MGKPTDEQRVIIENANANNMVIAAPGSGKSFTMIEAVISISGSSHMPRLEWSHLLALQQIHWLKS
jgi:hypothetical protein